MQRLLLWALTAVATLAAVALGWRAFTPPPSAPPLPALKYTLPITGDSLERTALPTISPDGRHVAFVKNGTLWVRSLDQLEPRQLAGTAGAQFPFWSPDGLQVAYLTANSLWRASASTGVSPSGSPRIGSAKADERRAASGAMDNTIVFALAATGSGMLSVPAQGGEFVDYYKHDPKIEGDIHRPSLLPDKQTLLFVVDRVDTGADTIGVLANGTRKDILRIENETLDSPAYSPTGHIHHRETTTLIVGAAVFARTAGSHRTAVPGRTAGPHARASRPTAR